MRIDVEIEMTECVRRMNGNVLDDTYQHAQSPLHADFWFPTEQVVVELKCLFQHLETQPTFQTKVAKLYRAWVSAGLVPPAKTERVILETDKLPDVCARELFSLLRNRLEQNVLKKASAQINATKTLVGAPQAKGLLVLVNDGEYALPPATLQYFLKRCAKYSGIDSAICLSVNETVSGSLNSVRFWMDVTLQNRTPVPLRFREDFRTAWFQHLSRILPNTYIAEINAKTSGVSVKDFQFTNKPLRLNE